MLTRVTAHRHSNQKDCFNLFLIKNFMKNFCCILIGEPDIRTREPIHRNIPKQDCILTAKTGYLFFKHSMVGCNAMGKDNTALALFSPVNPIMYNSAFYFDFFMFHIGKSFGMPQGESPWGQ